MLGLFKKQTLRQLAPPRTISGSVKRIGNFIHDPNYGYTKGAIILENREAFVVSLVYLSEEDMAAWSLTSPQDNVELTFEESVFNNQIVEKLVSFRNLDMPLIQQ